MTYRAAPKVLRNGKLVPRYGGSAEAESTDVSAVVEADVEEAGSPLSAGRKAVIILFFVSIMLPISGQLGTVRMTPYTLLLLLAFFPIAASWLGKKHSPIVLPDILILLFCVWACFAVIYHHGFSEMIETNGILVLQTFGAYLLGRTIIRDLASTRFMVTVVAIALAGMIPFIIFESVTGNKILLKMASVLGQTPPDVMADKRMGLYRAQGAFEHPILMGVFSGSIFSIAAFAGLGATSFIRRMIAPVAAAVAAVFSLSTGALLSLNVQFGLIAWGRIFRDSPGRWKVLGLILGAFYVSIDLLSTRTPFHVFVTYATFNQTSSYARILIWEFGSAEVLRNPLLGIGYNDWQRPSYMGSSVDNFWLLEAMRYGIPAWLLLAGTLVTIVKRLGFAQLPNVTLQNIRKGMVFSLIGVGITIVSVHLWNASYVWFCFLLGACVWPTVLRPSVSVQGGAHPASSKIASTSAVGPRAGQGKRLRSNPQRIAN